LSVGQIDQAKVHAQKTLAALAPAIARGVPVVGLEPSCILSLRDEWLAMGLGAPAEQLSKLAVLFEEWWINHLGGQTLPAQTDTPAASVKAGKAASTNDTMANDTMAGTTSDLPPVLVHGHCHQKAMGAMSPTLEALRSVGLKAELIESSCCGMAGSFGYEASHLQVSMAMAEAKLLPAVRQAPANAWIVADGFSCRHQIADGAQRQALHVAQAISRALGVG
jgi:Fe-S oxidoreductase